MLKLVLRNLLRNKRRTVLTVGSVAVAILLLSLLSALLAALESAEGSADNRVIVRHAVSLTFYLPESYWRKVEALPHVTAVTPLNWYGGIYKNERPENFFAQFASDPGTLFDVYPEYRIPEEEKAAWAADRGGFLAGKALADRYGWRIGDKIFIKRTIYPVDLELTLRGVFTEPEAVSQERQVFFQREYLEEALDHPGMVGAYSLRIDSPDNVPAVIQAAEALFANSEAQVRAETEKAFQLSFLEMLGNVRALFGYVGLAAVVSILLRSLGFGKGRVFSLVVLESVAVALLGAAAGSGAAAGLLRAAASGLEKVFPVFATLRMTPGTWAAALAAALAIGLVSGLVPALGAARLRVADGLRRVA
jgi:putative ABC transport system permease protein